MPVVWLLISSALRFHLGLMLSSEEGHQQTRKPEDEGDQNDQYTTLYEK